MSNKYSDKIIDDVLNLLLIISNKYEILTYIVEDKGQELYEDKIYVAEYLRRHGMEDDAHEVWLNDCMIIIGEILNTDIGKIIFGKEKKCITIYSGKFIISLDFKILRACK